MTALSGLVFPIYLASAIAADWPQWRGQDRANRSSDSGLLSSWPTNGPPLRWIATGLGSGIASVSVANEQLYTMGYRDYAEFVFALDPETGEMRWASRVGPEIGENPLMRWLTQRSPTVDQDRLYAMSGSGDLICVRTSDGQTVWKKSYPNDFLVPRRRWGFADWPLVDGEKLICSPAGPNATMVALNKRTGDILWKTRVRGEAWESYAPTVVWETGGLKQYVVFLGGGLAGIDANDGRVLWRYAGTSDSRGNSYTPIVHSDKLFSASGYGSAVALLKLARQGDSVSAEEEYRRSLRLTPFQDATVLVGDYLYLLAAPGSPACLELKTGQLTWGPITNVTKDRGALTYADGHLYIRHASGRVVLVEADPKRYAEKGMFVIPDREEASGVTSPVVAGGRLYLRDNSRLLCYDVRNEVLAKPTAAAKIVAISLTKAHTNVGPEALNSPRRPNKNRAPDAVFVPTPEDVVEKMLELGQVKKDDVVVDLGSGDGRFVIRAAKRYGSRAIGYEIDPHLVQLARGTVQAERLESLVRIEHEDIFNVDLREVDVVIVYLPSALLGQLVPQFQKLKPGTRIVSHQFAIPGVRIEQSERFVSGEDGDSHTIYVWTMPFAKSQR